MPVSLSQWLCRPEFSRCLPRLFPLVVAMPDFSDSNANMRRQGFRLQQKERPDDERKAENGGDGRRSKMSVLRRATVANGNKTTSADSSTCASQALLFGRSPPARFTLRIYYATGTFSVEKRDMARIRKKNEGERKPEEAGCRRMTASPFAVAVVALAATYQMRNTRFQIMLDVLPYCLQATTFETVQESRAPKTVHCLSHRCSSCQVLLILQCHCGSTASVIRAATQTEARMFPLS